MHLRKKKTDKHVLMGEYSILSRVEICDAHCRMPIEILVASHSYEIIVLIVTITNLSHIYIQEIVIEVIKNTLTIEQNNALQRTSYFGDSLLQKLGRCCAELLRTGQGLV